VRGAEQFVRIEQLNSCLMFNFFSHAIYYMTNLSGFPVSSKLQQERVKTNGSRLGVQFFKKVQQKFSEYFSSRCAV
jgi:hypothetical protein